MKRLVLFILSALTSAWGAQAAVITVDNNPNSAGQFTNLQNAINAASPGDTLYISGSTGNYGQVHTNKRLCFIGTGYNPMKQIPMTCYVQDIYLDSLNSISGSSGTYISGLTTNSVSASYAAKNITVERMRMNYGIGMNSGSSGWIIRNCFLNASIDVSNSSNVLIENNVIYDHPIQTSSQSSVVISNNIFLNTLGSGSFCLNGVSMATVQNNIFWGTSPLGTNVINNTFNNNLTFQTGSDNIPGANNNGSNNQVGQNPQWVNAPSPAINYSYDYNVTSGSPAHNAGSDGSDMGIYGGLAVMPDQTGMPAIPQMLEMNIHNPVIVPAGTLNVDFKAKKNN
jgi:hypothetical protein